MLASLSLDEPTNHLDMETIDSELWSTARMLSIGSKLVSTGLASAIKSFQGGTLLVSHDFRLIDQVAQEIWIAADEVGPCNG